MRLDKNAKWLYFHYVFGQNLNDYFLQNLFNFSKRDFLYQNGGGGSRLNVQYDTLIP